MISPFPVLISTAHIERRVCVFTIYREEWAYKAGFSIRRNSPESRMAEIEASGPQGHGPILL